MNSVIVRSKNYIKVFKEERPWGDFQKFVENQRVTVKIITVLKDKKLSLQYHLKRDEFWKVIKGKCLVTVGDNIFTASEGDTFNIPRETLHRVEAKSDVWIMEICKGRFKESDIVRVEDDYGR